jgi:hypothetical protein
MNEEINLEEFAPWLVYSHNDYTDPQGLIPQTLAAKMRLAREREFYGGRVQLYETP